MTFPRDEIELEAEGYVFEGTGKCRECKADLAWYRTPTGKRMPLDQWTLVPHWGTCSAPERFRKVKAPK